MWGSGVWLHAFLTPALDLGEWSSSHSDRCTSGTRGVGAWVGPGDALEVLESNHSSSVFVPVTLSIYRVVFPTTSNS